MCFRWFSGGNSALSDKVYSPAARTSRGLYRANEHSGLPYFRNVLAKGLLSCVAEWGEFRHIDFESGDVIDSIDDWGERDFLPDIGYPTPIDEMQHYSEPFVAIENSWFLRDETEGRRNRMGTSLHRQRFVCCHQENRRLSGKPTTQPCGPGFAFSHERTWTSGKPRGPCPVIAFYQAFWPTGNSSLTG